MTQLLCCVDGSDHAELAIRMAARLARGLDAQLTFLLVNTTLQASGGGVVHAWSEIAAAAVLDQAAERARQAGVRSQKALTAGRDAAAAILDRAEQAGVDHIVIGAGTASLLGRLLLGSTAQTVVLKARCAVTVAR